MNSTRTHSVKVGEEAQEELAGNGLGTTNMFNQQRTKLYSFLLEETASSKGTCDEFRIFLPIHLMKISYYLQFGICKGSN